MTNQPHDDVSIAIIGMAGRFPGAASVEELWENLKQGKECIARRTDEELRAAGVDDSLLRRPNYIGTVPRLEGIELFDPAFFGYTLGQAACIDPQHRLFLECAWQSLEMAGYNPETYEDSIGVFAGASESSYRDIARQQMRSAADTHQLMMDSASAFMPMRASYKLNLRGPSIAVQTACSTSLVAVHLACQSLLNFECAMALAGGAAVGVPQAVGYIYEEGGILSPDGHCRAFDADAKGTIPGSGVGVVVLKRLSDALRDGDEIHAVIRGTAVNNDGLRKVGFTAPAFHGQVEGLTMALEFSGVEPQEIGMIEAHGTGTVLGDAIELAALTQVFGGRKAPRSCALGSLKTNIGHLDAAAGVAGLIKAVLCLKHQALVPSLHYKRPNQALDTPDTPFFVNTAFRSWHSDGQPRLAGVSSFGIGGTNALAILQESPERLRPAAMPQEHVFLLSARSAAALAVASDNLAEFVRSHGEVPIADIAYTLQVGRKRFRHRRALVAADSTQLLAGLARPAVVDTPQEQDDRPVVFVFSGSEPQPAVAADLYLSDSVFKLELDRCTEVIASQSSVNVSNVLLTDAPADARARMLATFAAEYCLGRLWLNWGVRPAAVIGYGAGEFAAACLAGIFSLDDAVRLLLLNEGEARNRPSGGAGPIKLSTPAITFIRGATGKPVTELPTLDDWLAPSGRATAFTIHVAEHMRDSQNILFEVGLGRSIEESVRATLAPAQPLTWIATGTDRQRRDRRDLLQILGTLWLRGAVIGWPRNGADQKRYRVALPGYPFERQRCWIDSITRPSAGPAEAVSAVHGRLPPEQWFYAPSWKTSPAPELVVVTEADRSHDWLLFADEGALGRELAARLTAHGCRVVTVLAGDEYTALGNDTFLVNPHIAGHQCKLLENLRAAGRQPRHAIYCWSVSSSAARAGNAAEARRCTVDVGFFHLTHAAARAAAPLSILAITDGVHSVAGEEAPFSEKGSITGLSIVAAQEHPQLQFRVVDLPQAHRLDYADWILSEALQPSRDLLIAYRGNRRWVRCFEHLQLGANGAPVRSLRDGGTYLITGGLGGIGLTLAEYLARDYRANLVLLTRGSFPARDAWESCLRHDAGDEVVSARIRRLQGIERCGARVMVVNAEVHAAPELSEAVRQAQAQFGQIHGVFHLAADIRHASLSKPVVDLTVEDFETQLLPKLQGWRVVDEALKDTDVDFAIAFSSNAATLGGIGFGAYAAANACLDHVIAAAGRSPKARWISTNWDGWQLSADVSGTLDGPQAFTARQLVNGEEGMAALARIVSFASAPQVVISATDLEARIATWVAPNAGRSPEPVVGANSHSSPVRSDGAGPRTDLERDIAAVWEEVLGVSGVGVNDDFFGLGGDSLTGLRVLARLRERFHVDVPLDAFLESAATISSLAVEIVSQLAERQDPEFLQQQLSSVEGAS